jgi:glutathione S-transferase
MRIFHIATLADWQEAQRTGSYTTSTIGRTLEEEGFIHAAYDEQVPVVRDRFYADVTEPLVVLEIDTDLLAAEVREEQVGDEVYPHVYGPIPASAVVAWRPARLPPIELGSAHPAGPPTPATTVAFRGVGLVLGLAGLASFFAAALAASRVDDGSLPEGVAFLLWSLTVVLAVAAATAFGYGEWARLRAARES